MFCVVVASFKLEHLIGRSRWKLFFFRNLRAWDNYYSRQCSLIFEEAYQNKPSVYSGWCGVCDRCALEPGTHNIVRIRGRVKRSIFLCVDYVNDVFNWLITEKCYIKVIKSWYMITEQKVCWCLNAYNLSRCLRILFCRNVRGLREINFDQ